MIFVTVGAQMPFPRLIHAVDDWAGRNAESEIFAQIGHTHEQPRNLPWTRFIAPEEFRRRMSTCDLVVAHAGTGSIITALLWAKPIIVMPRRGDLRETRNDHQLATARRFQEAGYCTVAMTADELVAQLDRRETIARPSPIPSHASDELLGTIEMFIGRQEDRPTRADNGSPSRSRWRRGRTAPARELPLDK